MLRTDTTYYVGEGLNEQLCICQKYRDGLKGGPEVARNFCLYVPLCRRRHPLRRPGKEIFFMCAPGKGRTNRAKNQTALLSNHADMHEKAKANVPERGD